MVITKNHVLSLAVPRKYSEASVIVGHSRGKFEGGISASASDEAFLLYTEEDLPLRLNSDFYVGTAGFRIFPSKARVAEDALDDDED